MGISLYHLVEIIEANEDVIETPAEELALWHRMSIYDARAMLGLYCYRAGYYPAALAQWTRIPESNRKLRPSIQQLLEELNSRLALEEQETQPMRREVATAGFHATPWGSFPRLQLLTVAELLDGRRIEYPAITGGNQTYKAAPKAMKKVAESPSLFESE